MPDGPILELHPIIRRFWCQQMAALRVKCALTFQAVSLLVDSNRLRIEIAWDGQWADGKDEMARHLVITASPQVA